MTSSKDFDFIKDSDWILLNEQCDRLEKAWRDADGDTVDLSEFLPPRGDPRRHHHLIELIQTELEIRWRRKLPVTLEDYLGRFPDLGPSAALPASLIYEEYRARHLYGDCPALAGYRDRFPAQFDQLQRLLQEHPLTLHYPTLRPSAGGGSTPALTPQAAANEFPAGDRLMPNEGYTLGPEIGAGQFGRVYRARAPGGVEVAVKIIYRPLTDESCQREKRALEMICQLNHPYLLQTHTFWSLRDRLIVVMELADGSLLDWFKACKAAGQRGIPALELVAYFREAAEALDCLHAQRIMHRDIKPANLLRLKGYAKVADFGLMRLQEQRLEQATIFGGTPGYMAPETWRNQVSIHSDQYSLAVAYAEMRLGRLIFRGSSQLDIAMQHEKGTPNLDGVEAAERDVLLRALAKKPDDRYASCRAFIDALDAALQPPPPVGKRSFTGWALVAVTLALLGFMGYSYFFSSPVPTPTPSVETSLELPAGFVADEERIIIRVYGKDRLKRIRYTPLEGVDPVVFILIEKTQPQSPPPFYIMENKVSRAQFAALLPRMEEYLKKFAHETPIREGIWRTVRRKWNQQWLKDGEPKWPATSITPTEAHCFALCFGNNGCLPSVQEWDAAGGFYDGKSAPFEIEKWNKKGEPNLLAINLPPHEFWNVGIAKADVSCHGCRDMGGNGYEWTRNVTGGKVGEVVPVAHPNPYYSVLRRGKRPDADEPFFFENARSEPVDYGEAPRDTSFRVVLPLDE